MRFKIALFAHLRDKAGRREVELDLPAGASVADLKAGLAAAYPVPGPALPNALVAINQEYAEAATLLAEGAEVALFPPVSGGAAADVAPTLIKVVDTLPGVEALLATLTRPTTGAACLFAGLVRGETTRAQPHSTIELEYEAYVPMAEAKLAQVAAEIRERWPTVEGIAIYHRVGQLAVGDPIVYVACTAAHRDTGVFAAAQYGIDRLKEIVPIWKKEIGPGGATWVEGDYHPAAGE